jgi:CheY-like chemotaxis protein/anti-sigma regulatory factor (Ser/Thr protein kinase)
MSTLLASVLDISKLDSGAVQPEPVVAPLNEVFERLRSDFEPVAADKGLTLVVESTRDGVHTDPELLRRMLGNLLSNAIRYTDRGTVTLRSIREGETLHVQVRDTGIGIPPDQVERVFEEFYQIDHSSQRPEGLGLGLSIVRRYSVLLRCPVTVQSEVGVGTTFTVTAPRAALPVAAVDRPEDGADDSAGHILVVDDEQAVAEATSLLLELEGFAVRIASCEREALEHTARQIPDLIVSDYHLRGGETGVAVVTAVRSKVGGPIPVVFVTGDTGRSAFTQSKIENARVLSKPIRADDLVATIRASIVR